jgi:hypothetical protein
MIRKPCLMADRRDESKRMRDPVSAPHRAIGAGNGSDRRMAQHRLLKRIRLPTGSRKAQSRTPYSCSVGLDDVGTAGPQPGEGAVEVGGGQVDANVAALGHHLDDRAALVVGDAGVDGRRLQDDGHVGPVGGRP